MNELLTVDCGVRCDPTAPSAAINSSRARYVTREGFTRLPDAMLAELRVGDGKHVWFLRGGTRWEAWTEEEIESMFKEVVGRCSVETERRETGMRRTFEQLYEIDLQRLHRVLSKVEWGGDGGDYGPICPCCGCSKPFSNKRDHTPGCELDAARRDLEERLR